MHTNKQFNIKLFSKTSMKKRKLNPFRKGKRGRLTAFNDKLRASNNLNRLNSTELTLTPGEKIRDHIIENSMNKIEALSYAIGNAICAAMAGTKLDVCLHSAKASAISIFKGSTDYARQDYTCTTLCGVSSGCEVFSAIYSMTSLPYTLQAENYHGIKISIKRLYSVPGYVR